MVARERCGERERACPQEASSRAGKGDHANRRSLSFFSVASAAIGPAGIVSN
jgi:hypothetical protein